MLPAVVLVTTLAAMSIVVLRAPRNDVALGASLMLLAFFVSFLHVWEHHYSAVLLAGVFLLAAITSGQQVRERRREWILVGVLSLLAAPSPFVLLPSNPAAWTTSNWILLSLSKAAPTAVVLVTGVNYLRGARVQASHSNATATKWTEPNRTVPPAT